MPDRILRGTGPWIRFWIHGGEILEINGGKAEGIGAGPGEKCGPANFVVPNSDPQCDGRLVVEHRELRAMILVKANDRFDLQFTQRASEIVLLARIEAG